MSSPLLQFLLEVSQKDPRVLSGREQTLPLQSIPPSCDLDTFCCEHRDYKVLIMSHEVTEWLTSSSSATSLFFATSPMIASRRDKNLSCRKKILFSLTGTAFSFLPMLHIFISFTSTVRFGTWQQNSMKLSLIPQNLRSSA